MLKRLCLFTLLALLISPLSAALAQADPFPNRYVAPDAGFTVYYPIGWTAELSDSSVTMSSGVIWLNVYRVVPGEMGISPDDGAALLERAYNPIDTTIAFDPAGVIAQPESGRRIFTYAYEDTNENGPYSGFVVAVEASDGSYLLADIYPRQGASVAQADLDLSLDVLRVPHALRLHGVIEHLPQLLHLLHLLRGYLIACLYRLHPALCVLRARHQLRQHGILAGDGAHVHAG